MRKPANSLPCGLASQVTRHPCQAQFASWRIKQSPACVACAHYPPRKVHYPPRTRGHSSLFVPILSPPIQLIQDRRGRFASCGPKSRGQRAEAGVPARAATGALALLAADHGRADGSRPSGRGARRRCTSACLDSRSTPAYPARWALFEGLWHVAAGARVAASSVSRCQGAKQRIPQLSRVVPLCPHPCAPPHHCRKQRRAPLPWRAS